MAHAAWQAGLRRGSQRGGSDRHKVRLGGGRGVSQVLTGNVTGGGHLQHGTLVGQGGGSGGGASESVCRHGVQPREELTKAQDRGLRLRLHLAHIADNRLVMHLCTDNHRVCMCVCGDGGDPGASGKICSMWLSVSQRRVGRRGIVQWRGATCEGARGRGGSAKSLPCGADWSCQAMRA